MITDLYISATVQCSLKSQSHNITNKDSQCKTISIKGELEKISWLIRGDAYLVWPNREGEGFALSHMVKKIATLKYAEGGVSISYPATASLMAFLLRTKEGVNLLFYMDRDERGRVCDIRLKSEGEEAVIIDVTAIHKTWNFIEYSEEITLKKYLQSKLEKNNVLKQQFQLGLIGPDGQCSVPDHLGFNIIPVVADLIRENYNPETSCIHIFGYSAGHDILYPDYSPSRMLGGQKILKAAINKTKDLGFETSFYLNGRIVDSEALENFPQLKKSLLRDNKGTLIKEKYQNRIFYVVNPSSPDWEECLLSWTQLLADCGADTVQLDQLGGRAAVKENGYVWGEGYNRIIDRIHELGMKVWIQGVSDYYRADRFEMTFRDLKILEGGILRGGNPFGKNDLSLIKIFEKDHTFIATESKFNQLEERDELDFIIDLPDCHGQLPLYSNHYINMLKNAKTALR